MLLFLPCDLLAQVLNPVEHRLDHGALKVKPSPAKEAFTRLRRFRRLGAKAKKKATARVAFA